MNPKFSRYYQYIKPIARNKNVQTYSSLSLSVFAIIIFTIFAIKPTIDTIVQLRNEIQKQEQTLEQINSKVASLEQGIQSYQKEIAPDQKLKLITLVPISTAVSCFINEVNATATLNQVAITGVQVQPINLVGTTKCNPEPVDVEIFKSNLSDNLNLKEIEFTVNSQAAYPQLLNMLTTVQNASRLVNIQSINFNKSPEGPLVLSVNGKAYFYSR